MFEGALSGPNETKCLMYVNARSMVITDQQAMKILPIETKCNLICNDPRSEH